MKIFKVLTMVLFTMFYLWIGKFIYPLFMICLNDMYLVIPYEKEGVDRPVAKKFIDKTYLFKQDLILAQFSQDPPSCILDRFSIEDDLVVPIEADRKFADYWERVEKGTKLTIKKVNIQAFPFQGESPIPKFYAIIEGYEDKGLIDVSSLFSFDFDFFYEVNEQYGNQIAIMESANQKEEFIHLIN